MSANLSFPGPALLRPPPAFKVATRASHQSHVTLSWPLIGDGDPIQASDGLTAPSSWGDPLSLIFWETRPRSITQMLTEWLWVEMSQYPFSDWLLPPLEAILLVHIYPKIVKMTQTLVTSKCQKKQRRLTLTMALQIRNPDPASYFRYEILACSNLQSFLPDF